MLTESTIDQKRDFADSASITKTESVENIEKVENMTMNITEKLATDFKALKSISRFPFLKHHIAPLFMYKRQVETIKRLEKHLDRHFNEIINLKDPRLDDIVILAESFICMCEIKLPSIVTQEDLYTAEFFLTRSIVLLKNKELGSKTVLTSMRAFNDLSCVYIRLENLKRSSQYLNKALELYFAYTKEQDEFPVPVNIETIVGIKVESDTVYLLNNMYMSSLSTLIKLNNHYHELTNMEKIVTCMHKLLNKLLIIYKPLSINYIEWALEAIQLAEYFLFCHRLIECKSHLCAASIMMMRCYNETYMIINEKTSAKDKDVVHGRLETIVSIIDMIWVKYGLVMLYTSRKRLLQKEEEENNLGEAIKSKTEFTTQPNKKLSELLIFTGTNGKFNKFAYMMPDDYITNYGDAKILFVRIVEVLNNLKAGIFASVSAEFRAEIAHYTSKAYKYLAFYEHDKIKQMKLQKRRIDVLEDCLKTLHAKNNLENCMFLWFELGVIYSTLIDIKMENLKVNKITAEDLVEINPLVKSNVHYFQLYLDITKQIDADRNDQIMFHFNLRYNKTQVYANLSNK